MPSTPVVVLDSTLTDIANAIRSKTGSSATMTPSEMPAQIMSISPAYETTSTAGAFYTDMVTPLEKLLVGFMPKQSGSGTPSLSNIRPIVGWTSLAINHNGKNLFDKDKPLVTGKYITADGSIGELNGYQYSDYYTPVNPNAGYIFSGTFGGTAYNTISFYDVSKNFISRLVPASPNIGAQFTTPSNCYYIRFNMGKNADLSTIQLEVGSTATTYEPYQSVSYEADWGKNLWGGFASDFTKNSSGITFVTKADGTITNTAGTTSAIAYSAFTSEAMSNGLTKTLGAGTYCISGASGDIMLDVCDTSGNALATDTGSGATFTLSAQQTVFVRVRVASGKTLTAGTTKPLLESGNQPTAYEPYVGTVYGGTLGQVGGQLTDSMGIVDLGSLKWIYETQGFMRASSMRSVIKAPATGKTVANIVCSGFEAVASTSIYNGSNGIGIHYNGDIRVRYDNMPTDPTAFKTAMDGVQLCYELATPQTYQLTPQQIRTLMGNNVVTAEGADVVEVVYLAHALPAGYQADTSLVACYRSSDNALGIYDLVNNVFYPNASTVNLSMGSNMLANAETSDLSMGGDVLANAETDDFSVGEDV